MTTTQKMFERNWYIIMQTVLFIVFLFVVVVVFGVLFITR